MKKLMTVIAAVAMSFGLFAESASHFISFETADKCVQDGKLVKTGWTGDASVIDLVGGYNYSGADARRDAAGEPGFDGGTENFKCLKLETGSNQVVCTPDGDTDNIYFDQTVKFTGYEEAPTVTGGKIAVWMSAIEAEGTEGEDGYIAGETNLYVTCAKVNAAGVATPTNICIGAYDIDAWHRVTIKSLGDIADSVPRAGFLVYIDGAQVGSYEGIAAIGGLQEKFQSYSTSGILFPALDAEVATVTSVAYQGIGELDDVAIDELGPQFARFVEGLVAQIPGATLKITDENGDEIEVKDNKFQAAPGAAITLTYTAENGKFLSINGKQEVVYAEHITQDHKDFTEYAENVEVKVAVAGVSSDEDYIYYASLQEAITAATGTEEFPAGVKLFVDTAENVTVAADKYIELDMAGFSLNNKSNYYTIENKGYLAIYDSRENVEDVADLAVIGFVKDASWTYASSTIRNLGTLEISGIKVYNDTFIAVKNDEDLAKEIVGVCTLNGVVFDGADQSVQNWGTLTINGGIYNKVFTWAEPTCNSGYTEIYDGTFNDAVASVQQYNDTIGWSETPAMVKIYGGTFNAKVYGTYTTNFKGEDPERGTIEIYPADEEEEIPGGIFAEANKPNVAYIVNTPAEGYQNAWVAAEEAGYVTPGEELIPTYVAKIGDVEYTSLADAFAAVDDNQTITLLTAVDESVLYEGAKKFTIDLNGQTWTWNGGQTGNWAALKVFGGAADITIVDGAADGKMYAAGDGFCIWAKTGTVTINSGKFYNNSNDDYAIYVNGTAAVVINDGEFRNEKDAPYIWRGDLAKLNLNVENNNPNATITVYGGTFSAEPKDDSGVNFVAEGYKAVVNGGIWTVRALEKYAITIGTIANATLTIDGEEAANFEATEDQEYTLAVEAATGYNTPVITFEGETIPAGKYFFTKAGALAASAEAIEYNITYTFTGVEDADKSKIVNPNAETKTFTVVSETITFAAATCEGYEFKGFAPASITKGTIGDQEIVGTFEKKSAGPVVNPGDDEKGEIKVDGTTAEVTLKGDATDIRIEGGESLTEVTVPVQLKQIRGVNADAIKVKAEGEDITAAFTKTVDGSTGYVQLELNPAVLVTLSDGTEVAVTPTIGENVEASEVDITAGEIAVQAIPGLTYELIRSTKLGDKSTEALADSAKAETAKVELTDKIEGEKPAAAFYQIKVEAK